LSPFSEQFAPFVRRSSIKNWVTVYQSSRRLISKDLNVDLNDGFAVVFRGYTPVVSGERRVIAVDELRRDVEVVVANLAMLQYDFPAGDEGNHDEYRLKYRHLGEGCYPIRNKVANH
jgi:hypothetical protein